MFKVGLNPYGLAYTLGIQGHGSERAYGEAEGLEGFLSIARQIGAGLVELHAAWLAQTPSDEIEALAERLRAEGITPVLASSLWQGDPTTTLKAARAVGAGTIRLALSRVLCGDRAALGDDWPALVEKTRRDLADYAERADGTGVTLAIENHQDFGSAELVAFCEEAGDNVGICYDTGNSFPVAEAPVAFTQRIAHKVRHVHLKDYRIKFTDEGLLLVRCPVGSGAVPLREIDSILEPHSANITAAIELAALEARHVRLLTPSWWQHYPQQPAEELAACLAAARRNRLPDEDDHRTPWERGEDSALPRYERDQLEESVANLAALGIMGATA